MSLDEEWAKATPDLSSEWERAKPSSSGPMPVNAGIASLVAGIAGAPVDIAQGVYNAPKMVYGMARSFTPRGLAPPSDLPEPVTGTPGGSESIRRALNIAADVTGVRGLSTENP